MSNSHEEDEWEEVGSFGLSWEPKATGSSKTNDYKPKEATDKSWLKGYYLGTKEDVGINKSQVHTFRLIEVGDSSDLSGEESQNVSVWGSGVLDKKIAENITTGMTVLVKWLGQKASMKPGGKPYHDWEVKYKKNAEPLGSASIPADLQKAAAESAPNDPPVSASSSMAASDDDDLPF